jgi:hypothetical protein
MIRTTYRGRAIKVLAARGNPFQRKLVINGQIISHGRDGDDVQGLDWFRQIIDLIESNGGAGMVAMLIPGQYTEPHWYEPGSIDINPAGHATRPGSVCLCPRCTTDGVPRFGPLPVNACRHCHEGPDSHNPRPLSVAGPHRYTEPTPVQHAGRQAAIGATR